jgi:hypothetical protein
MPALRDAGATQSPEPGRVGGLLWLCGFVQWRPQGSTAPAFGILGYNTRDELRNANCNSFDFD